MNQNIKKDTLENMSSINKRDLSDEGQYLYEYYSSIKNTNSYLYNQKKEILKNNLNILLEIFFNNEYMQDYVQMQNIQ
jgi:hypothetical protein